MFYVYVILVVLLVLVVAILAIASTRPDIFRVKRSTTIQASPEKIFEHLNDFHRWTGWSPWEKMDPNLQRNYSGSSSGKGAIYEWSGNKKVGKGRMEIIESQPPHELTIQLNFLEPFAGQNMARFTLQPQGHHTPVIWSMEGRNPFMGKVFSLFMDMDNMIGKDFETGLANLKLLTEN